MSINKLKGVLSGAALVAMALFSGNASADWTLNMPEGVTPISHDVYHLHMLIFTVCVVIAAIVFGAMIFSIIFHRKSRGVQPAHFHESTTVEIVWTVIPFLILVAMAIPAAKVLVKMEDFSGTDMSIKITGYQWKWRYTYMGEGVDYYSTLADSSNKARQVRSGIDPNSVDHYLLDVDHPLVVPTHKKIRLLITSGDVIHSWWVPDFGGKKDAIPGFINHYWIEVDKPGTYRGQCAELCGRGHAFMPIVVVAKTPEEFKSWLAEQKKQSGSDQGQSMAMQAGGAPSTLTAAR